MVKNSFIEQTVFCRYTLELSHRDNLIVYLQHVLLETGTVLIGSFHSFSMVSLNMQIPLNSHWLVFLFVICMLIDLSSMFPCSPKL